MISDETAERLVKLRLRATKAEAALTALRQRHEKLREAALVAYREWHHECDLDELGDAIDADLAADKGEVEPPDGQY